MKSWGYIWTGIGCIAVAVILLLMVNSDDAMQESLARAQLALGETPDTESDLWAEIVALLLFAAAAVSILIGAIGLGVKAGRSDD